MAGIVEWGFNWLDAKGHYEGSPFDTPSLSILANN